MKQSDPTIENSHFESLYPSDTRSEEIKQIFEYIKSGRSCQIVGIPGAGKSNVLGLLSYNRNVRLKHLGENQKWFHFVYMDFSEVRKRNLYDVIKFMLISTAYSLSERNLKTEYEVVNKFLKEAIDFNDEMILFQALKKSIDYLAIEKELTIVFLFDRFEQYLQNVNEQFFMNLKILRNRAKYRFSSVFACPRPLEDILEPYIISEFYEFLAGNTIYINLFDKPGIDFRFSYIEKISGKKADEKIKEVLLKLTGGHGKLSRIAYETVLADEKISDLKEFLFNKNTIKSALFEILNYLTPSEQIILKRFTETPSVIARIPNLSRETKQSLPIDEPSKEEIATSTTKVETHDDKIEEISYLEKVGLLKNREISIPLLSTLIKTVNVQKSQDITFNAEKNEILKGTDSLTEKLSPSEFRLLRFLILNTERVVEKEEIIQNVWKDTKTQEGVTDQALDQIVYRLRKKIEEDPNNPVHLQTVKGRGLKFTP